MQPTHPFDVAIIGAGASGSALAYALARYTNIPRIALIEKYAEPGRVNSNAKNNSQTLHIGEIETNYSIEKAREVRPAALMVKRYVESLPEEARAPIMRQMQKMVLGVGANEVAMLRERFGELKKIFPELKLLEAKDIAALEPAVMEGRDPREPVLAFFNPEGYAVNYGNLARSLVSEAERLAGKRLGVFFNHEVAAIEKAQSGYTLKSPAGDITASIVIVDTDAYSLGFAKSLGLGEEFSLIPVAGSFYFSRGTLRGKVYRVQEKRMPFAAVHGDPDLTKEGLTRWGPTARFYPVLEAGKFSSMKSFFASSGFGRLATWVSFVSILLEPVRFWYLLKNLFYEIPVLGTYFFLPQVRKIVPALTAKDLTYAKGYGGMRLQRVDTRSRELLLGEGKIVGEHIIFNMTPSPGASVSLYNAMRDAEQVMKFNPAFAFDKAQMLKDLCVTASAAPSGEDVSLKESYAS